MPVQGAPQANKDRSCPTEVVPVSGLVHGAVSADSAHVGEEPRRGAREVGRVAEASAFRVEQTRVLTSRSIYHGEPTTRGRRQLRHELDVSHSSRPRRYSIRSNQNVGFRRRSAPSAWSLRAGSGRQLRPYQTSPNDRTFGMRETTARVPWNKDKLSGQKLPLKVKAV
jgi:hypothetical protein